MNLNHHPHGGGEGRVDQLSPVTTMGKLDVVKKLVVVKNHQTNLSFVGRKKNNI